VFSWVRFRFQELGSQSSAPLVWVKHLTACHSGIFVGRHRGTDPAFLAPNYSIYLGTLLLLVFCFYVFIFRSIPGINCSLRSAQVHIPKQEATPAFALRILDGLISLGNFSASQEILHPRKCFPIHSTLNVTSSSIQMTITHFTEDKGTLLP
jgi:hypothetical protein